jgi:hypothetical protein
VGRWGKSLENAGKFGVRRRGRGGVSRGVGAMAASLANDNDGTCDVREVA